MHEPAGLHEASRSTATRHVAERDTFLVTLLVLMALGVALALTLPPSPPASREAVDALLPHPGAEPERLRPEPKERAIFTTLALAAPLAPLCVRRLLKRPLPNALSAWAVRLLVGAGATLIAMAVLPPFVTLLDWQAPSHLAGLAILALAVALASRSPRLAKAPWLAGTCVLGTSFAIVVALKLHGVARLVDWDRDEIHLEWFVYTIAQAAGGKRCVVDYAAQYGCYGELLAPVLTLLGSTIDALSWSMIALVAIALGAVLAFTRGALQTPLLVWTTASLLPVSWMIASAKVPMDVLDHYYQYIPLRALFPALSLPLGASWRRPEPARALAFGAFAALATFWNPDSGIAVTGSLLAVVGLPLLRRRRDGLGATLLGLAAFGLGFAATAFFLALYLRASGGAWPSPAALFKYPMLFYVTGWNMLPMPLEPSCWFVVAGIYLALIVRGVSGDRSEQESRAAMQVAVLGVGLFTYYVGRSYPGNLLASSWPAVVGVALLLDPVLQRARSMPAWPLARAAVSGSVALVLGLAGLLAIERLTWNIPQAIKAMPHFADHVALIERTSRPDQPIAVLALHQGVLLLHARRAQALRGPGLIEMALVQDLAALRAELEAGRVELAYVDRDLDQIRPQLIGPLRATLERQFVRVATSREGRLTVLRFSPVHPSAAAR